MKCDEFPWIEYIEDRLSVEHKKNADVHLNACSACALHRRKLELLISTATRHETSKRVGCPDPFSLVAADTHDATSWITQHLAACSMCKEELNAVQGIEADVPVERVPLPASIVEQMRVETSNKSALLAQEVISMVKARFCGVKPVIDLWRRGVGKLVADMSAEMVTEPVYAAPETAVKQSATNPMELTIRSGDVDVKIITKGDWIRAKASRAGVPLQGVTLRLENVLGEVTETATDLRGDAGLQDEIPGLKKITIETAKGARSE